MTAPSAAYPASFRAADGARILRSVSSCFVWRFLTDPITHACLAGLTGYFIGLAATGRHILFLGYAKVGSRSDLEVPGPRPLASRRHGAPSERPPATVT
jgi:hypothetical protein